jgi:hypothetical protein
VAGAGDEKYIVIKNNNNEIEDDNVLRMMNHGNRKKNPVSHRLCQSPLYNVWILLETNKIENGQGKEK